MQLRFDAIEENWPAERWQALFHNFWPGYRRWFLRHRSGPVPSRVESEAAIARYMPELLPLFRQLLRLAGDDALVAAFLSGHRPPPYLANCSQLARADSRAPVLIRNYDLDPALNEGVILKTRWCGRQVIAASEFLWGVADGMNDEGLALSLAFGGRETCGDGFGIPIILRYVLETCANVEEAIATLHRVPSHMAYNVTLLDASGAAQTVELAPGERPLCRAAPVATNHQRGRAAEPRPVAVDSREREALLEQSLAGSVLTDDELQRLFFSSPLYNTRYSAGFGTLYTAVYRPGKRQVDYCWPGHRWQQSFDAFDSGSRDVHYADGRIARVKTPEQQRAAIGSEHDAHQRFSGLGDIFRQVHKQLTQAGPGVPRFVIEAFAEASRNGSIPFAPARCELSPTESLAAGRDRTLSACTGEAG